MISTPQALLPNVFCMTEHVSPVEFEVEVGDEVRRYVVSGTFYRGCGPLAASTRLVRGECFDNVTVRAKHIDGKLKLLARDVAGRVVGKYATTIKSLVRKSYGSGIA